jgi:hypothetical protein
MFGGVKKEDYEKAVKATNEMRIKLEKMRLENALLKDQLRAVSVLEPNQSSLYIYLQLKESVTLDEIMESPKFSSRTKKDVIQSLEGLLQKHLIDLGEKNGMDYYSVATADVTGGYASTGPETIVTPMLTLKERKKKPLTPEEELSEFTREQEKEKS